MLGAMHERGQGLAEYAILISLVALVVILVLVFMGPLVGNLFSSVNSGLQINS